MTCNLRVSSGRIEQPNLRAQAATPTKHKCACLSLKIEVVACNCHTIQWFIHVHHNFSPAICSLALAYPPFQNKPKWWYHITQALLRECSPPWQHQTFLASPGAFFGASVWKIVGQCDQRILVVIATRSTGHIYRSLWETPRQLR